MPVGGFGEPRRAASGYADQVAGERFDLEPSIKTLLRDLGIPPARVLRRSGLPADLFAHRPIELSIPEYYRFWEALDAEASPTGERDLAVEIGKAISVEMFSPPIFAALCSPNLTTAAQRLATFLLSADGRRMMRAARVDALDEAVFVGTNVPDVIRVANR